MQLPRYRKMLLKQMVAYYHFKIFNQKPLSEMPKLFKLILSYQSQVPLYLLISILINPPKLPPIAVVLIRWIIISHMLGDLLVPSSASSSSCIYIHKEPIKSVSLRKSFWIGIIKKYHQNHSIYCPI